MSQLDRVLEARRAIRRAALARWLGRSVERERNRAAIATGGVGAADSPQRNARFQVREAGMARARALGRAGLLPLGLERKMGATLDYTPFAPSDAARRAGRPVARLVEMRGAGVQPEGFATGFLVAPRLLMTNHHVFPRDADAVGVGANFLFERSDRGLEAGVVFELDPGAFYVSDAALDFAIVAVKTAAGGGGGTSLDAMGVITLVEATPKILKGQPVNIIQYPDGGPKQYAVQQNRLVDILEQQGFLQYETDTLGGSSGSPAFSQSWELVALHHASIPKTEGEEIIAVDGKVWREEMGDDRVQWIANEGTRVSAIVGRLSAMRLADRVRQAMLDDLLSTTTDPVDDLARAGSAESKLPGSTAAGAAAAAAAATDSGDRTMANNQFTFSGPVTINVLAPAAAAGALAAAAAVADKAAAAVEAVMRFDPDYRTREGYSPAFLDPGGSIRVPTPGVAAGRVGELVKGANGKPRVLKYHHFELVMNAARRLQMWSAVNVDYSPARKSKRDRKEFGSDKWIPDKRLAAEDQIFDADFYKPAGNIDRGHIVRREDNAWGDSEGEIEFANSDTFHWTNCTPQHEAFNQSDPARSDPTYRGMKGLWGDFENYVQTSRKGTDTRACILAGPILDNEKDPEKDFGLGPVQYPLRFWKVVCVADPAAAGGKLELKTFGFILDQTDVVEKFGIETFGPGRFRRYQRSLKKITEASGVTFDQALHRADMARA